MLSSQVLTLVTMAHLYRQRPSELLDIGDPYVAYCLDEACAYILGQIRAGKQAKFPDGADKDKPRPTNNNELIDKLKTMGGVRILPPR